MPGHIHIYTGGGKGKTTSAVGLAVRARSRGLRVLFAQFMKKSSGGETELLKDMSITVMVFEDVLSPLFNPQASVTQIREAALRALDTLSDMLKDFDIVVLDEFNHLLAGSFITKDEALRFIASRPDEVDIIFTGRGSPQWLIEMADHVTEMREIKHPATKGGKARKGIEY